MLGLLLARCLTSRALTKYTPLDAPVGGDGTVKASSPSVTLAGLAGNELIFDTAFLVGADNTYDLAVAAGQTQQWNCFY